MNARVLLVHPFAREATVSPWDFPIAVEYDYDEGEPPVMFPTDRASPGTPPNAILHSAKVAGVDITQMLTEEQRERLEDAVLEQIED